MKSIFIVTIFLTIFSVGYYVFQQPDNYLHVIQCDVGQGDALLITFGSQQMLIDQGQNATVLECLMKYVPFWDRTLEVVIATHADQDHIGGLTMVIDNYTISHLFINPTDKSTKIIDQLNSIIFSHQITKEEAYLGDKISLKNKNGDVVFYVVSPEKETMEKCGFLNQKPEEEQNPNKSDCPKEYLSENNRSISGVLTYGEFDMVMFGDAESVIEEAVMRRSLIEDADVLKVSHHGSKYSTSDAFIQNIKPEIGIISVGKNNRYGHPTTRVIDTLRSNNIEILRTDELGSIEIVTNGNQYWIENN